MNYGYIYITENLKNGKVYIGQHKGIFNSNYRELGFYTKPYKRGEA